MDTAPHTIVERLDKYINRLGHDTTISKEKALKIVDLLLKEDKEYNLMLSFMKENIELYYDHPNENTKRQLNELLIFYNLIPSKRPLFEKRTVVERIGNENVVAKLKLKCKRNILRLF